MTIPLTVILLATSASAQLRAASVPQQAEIKYLMERANAAVNSGPASLARERKEELERKMGVRTKDRLIRIPTEADLKKLKSFLMTSAAIMRKHRASATRRKLSRTPCSTKRLPKPGDITGLSLPI